MPRHPNLINYAHLNDKKGDLAKSWYVEWIFRLPDNPKKALRFREYEGLGKGTIEQRVKKANEIIAIVNQYLKSGEYLNHPANYNPVRPDEDYRPETQAYNERANIIKISTASVKFLRAINNRIRPKTRLEYRSKMRYFCIYVENRLKSKPVTQIVRTDIVPFFEELGTIKHLSQKTIDKYMQVVRAFFTYLEDIGLRDYDTNPVKRIPKFGYNADFASTPFNIDERERLKAAISTREPYLWLACEFQYYCAIRPGTELRLAKVGMINRELRTITIPSTLAKNKTTESVGIPKILMDEIERLGIFNYPKNYYIFGRYGIPSPKPTGKNTLRNRFNFFRDALKISKDKKFYSWKHTGAISAAENNMPILEMKDYLRHKDVNTTMEYLRKRTPALGTQEKYIEKL